MKVTATTKEILNRRRARRDLVLAGYEEVGETGGRLWELHRGMRYTHVITDVEIDPCGKTLWIKTAEK